MVFHVSPLEMETQGVWYFQVLRAHMPNRDSPIGYSIKAELHTSVEEWAGKLDATLFEYQNETAKSELILNDINEQLQETTGGSP